MAEKKGFILYYDWEEYFDALESTEEVGELILALFAFAKRGEVEQFTGALKMAFTMMTRTIARDSEKWEMECRNRSEAARKRWDKEKSKVLYNSIPSSTSYNTLYDSIPSSMSYADNSNKIIDNSNQIDVHADIPCWSVAALLSVLPLHLIIDNQRYAFSMIKGLNKNGETYAIKYALFNTTFYFHLTDFYNNPVDACYEMILNLHELKML